MEIIYTSKFKRGFKKLPTSVQYLAVEKELIFREDFFDFQLNTHKLHGKFKDFWSFSIDHKYRIIFEFSRDRKKVYFHSIGDHDIYE